MLPEHGGYFVHAATNVREGQRYAFRLDGGPQHPDPASRWQPDGVQGPSAILIPEHFRWDEGNWSGVRREDLVIYELHVGTFTPEGTFDAVIPRLDALRELGVTAIELMPVAQFPGERNWGYDGVFPFAVQNSYGGPHGLQRLVNACHRAGLAVILDVVYNHLGPEGNYLAEFGPYFSGRYRTPWGKAMNFDGRDCDPVRALVLDNVRYWIRDFHIDGLRLDAVHAIFDQSPKHILREIKKVADEAAAQLGRPVHVIAESNLNDVRLLNPEDRGGYALDAQWSDDFHHSVHALLTGERGGYYADFGQPEQLVKALNRTFVLDGCYSIYRGRRHGAPAGDYPGDRFVVSIQNHDQVGNRACGDRFGTLLTPAQQRLAAGLLLLAPHVPLIFMGQEYGETRPFPFFCSFEDPQLLEAVRRGRRQDFASFNWPDQIPDPQAEATFRSTTLTWSWPEGTWHAGLRRLYRDLLTARRRWPALHDFRHRRAELPSGTGEPEILRLTRGGTAAGPDALVTYFNLGPSDRLLPDTLPPDTTLLLSSEEPQYGGRGADQTSKAMLAPLEFRVIGTRSTPDRHQIVGTKLLDSAGK
ncbi:MAG: malto-oligosyltrehalose trehalohydrolase [Planctomycetes bacterium]|nr:malto-oligosyltrehalose trehalohydrolase [Planctomycetota bacterium]